MSGGFDPDDFEVDPSALSPSVDLAEEVDVDLSKLTDAEVDSLETALAARQTRIRDLQRRVVTASSERDELAARVDALTTRNADLRAELETARTDRVDLEAADLLGEFGSALDDAEATLASARYGVADLRVDLKAGVVATDEGVRFHLPGVDESPNADLSTLSFGLRPRAPAPELGYERVPAVVGRPLDEALAALDRAGFAGAVANEHDGTTAAVVVDQVPSGRAVADPGATVDLFVASPHDESGDDGAAGDFGALPVEAVKDVGPTFGGRLREAGIDTVEDLASASVDRAASAADASVTRAAHWLDHARRLAAGDASGGDADVGDGGGDGGDA
jgi:hypothetical protein